MLRFICSCSAQYLISGHLLFNHFKLNSQQTRALRQLISVHLCLTVCKEIPINKCKADHCSLLSHAVPQCALLRLKRRKTIRHYVSTSSKWHQVLSLTVTSTGAHYWEHLPQDISNKAQHALHEMQICLFVRWQSLCINRLICTPPFVNIAYAASFARTYFWTTIIYASSQPCGSKASLM